MGAIPLHWGRANNTVTVSGSGTLAGFYNLTEGQFVEVAVSHAGQADFQWAETPRFAAVPGAAFLLDAEGTDGNGFRVLVMRISNAGPGGYGSADLAYTWTRTGGIV